MRTSKPKTAKPSFWKKPWMKNLRNPVEYRERIADGVCEAARRTLPNPSVYLMGSTHRGTAHHVSDLDLAIFHNLPRSEESDAQVNKLHSQIQKISQETGVIINANIYGPERPGDWEFPFYRQRISGPDLDLKTIPIEEDREGTLHWELREKGRKAMLARVRFDRGAETRALGVLGETEKMLSGISSKNPDLKKFLSSRPARDSIKWLFLQDWIHERYGANPLFILANNPRIRARMRFSKAPETFAEDTKSFEQIVLENPEMRNRVLGFCKKNFVCRPLRERIEDRERFLEFQRQHNVPENP